MRKFLLLFSIASLAAVRLAAQSLVSDLTVQRSVTLTGAITPTQITSDQDNYGPVDASTGKAFSTAAAVRLSSDAARAITGLGAGSSGRVVLFYNTGSFTITLSAESSSSLAANRFGISGSFALNPLTGVLLYYDATSSRWRLLGGAGGGSVTTSGLTMNTARLLGRTTGSAGAIEEITAGSMLSLSGGTLNFGVTGGTNTLLYTSSAGTPAALTTANNSVLVTNGSGVPSWSGSLSLGTPSTSAGVGVFTAYGSTDATTILMERRAAADAFSGGFGGSKARGSMSSPSALNSGDGLVSVWGGGYTGSGWNDYAARMLIVTSQAWTGANNGASFVFSVTPNNSTTRVDRFFINQDGTISAGSAPTTLTDSAGKILSAALNTVAVGQGGTGLTSGTSGGIPYFSSTSAITSSAALASGGVVIGGGAGAAPFTDSDITFATDTLTVTKATIGSITHVSGAIGAVSTITSGTGANLTLATLDTNKAIILAPNGSGPVLIGINGSATNQIQYATSSAIIDSGNSTLTLKRNSGGSAASITFFDATNSGSGRISATGSETLAITSSNGATTYATFASAGVTMPGVLTLTNTTDTTTSGTGAVLMSGGLSIAKGLTVGTALRITANTFPAFTLGGDTNANVSFDASLNANGGTLTMNRRLTALGSIQENVFRWIFGTDQTAWGTTGALITTFASLRRDNSTAASGTAASAVFISFPAPFLGATNTGVTTTDAATLYIGGGPSASGGNMTITSSWGLWNAGASRLDGNVKIAGQTGAGASPSSTAALLVAASTTGVASLRIPHGTAPSSPVDGDMWTTTTGLYVRINGVTVGPLN